MRPHRIFEGSNQVTSEAYPQSVYVDENHDRWLKILSERFRIQAFNTRRVNLSDEFDDGRQSTAVINKNIEAMSRIVKKDKRVTYHEIKTYSGIDTSQV
ncbi:hypothetical protein EVAR_40411_1 [Eumeta japonica]|uniref:Histone-lysine N-methyltransferase SETMAR n=1 Tax=Eumeta variegata TaxID=151549 RepID=A0A4C1WCX7_EUMVA|nr:hypothetical protein EVAR_40411_1 [Eumeta japonica]